MRARGGVRGDDAGKHYFGAHVTAVCDTPNVDLYNFPLALLTSRSKKKVVFTVEARPNPKNIVLFKELVEAGKYRPVIDRVYPLEDVVEATKYVDTWRKLEPGQRVLVHGASGRVGTYAVQIAKALWGEVTAVCGPRGVDIARSLGADVVVDYTQEDVTRGDHRFDLAIDIAGTRSFRPLRRMLAPGATVVVARGKRANHLLGPLAHVVGSRIASPFSSQKAVFFLAKLGKDDMETLRELLEAGKLRSVLDSTYPLDRLGDALEHMGDGHPQGKIVVSI